MKSVYLFISLLVIAQSDGYYSPFSIPSIFPFLLKLLPLSSLGLILHKVSAKVHSNLQGLTFQPKNPQNSGDEEIKRESLRADADAVFPDLKWDIIPKRKNAVVNIFIFPDWIFFFPPKTVLLIDLRYRKKQERRLQKSDCVCSLIFPSGCSAEGQRGFSKRSFSSVLEKKCPKQIPNSAGPRPTSAEGLLGQEVVDFLFSRDPSQSWAGLVGGRTTVRTTQIQNLNWERARRSSPQAYEDGRRCRFSLPIPVSLGRKAESIFGNSAEPMFP